MIKEIIKTQDAVGKMLGHDITRIVQGEFKGSLFRKGHILQPEDVDQLLNVGKYNIYVLTMQDGDVHEDDAGRRLGDAICGENTYVSAPKESRVNVFSSVDGILDLNVEAVHRINQLQYSICSTIPPYSVVTKDQMLAGTKVVPLVVNEKDVVDVEQICSESGPVVSVRPFLKKRVACLITGSEVYNNRIEDSFEPVLRNKIAAYGSEVEFLDFAPDDQDVITSKILSMKESGAEMILVTGGMSVDPDDRTPDAILATGAELVKQGAPVLPGAMFLAAYLDDIPVFGVPAAGMYFQNTMLDRMLPRAFADMRITRDDIVRLGVGGLIMNNQRYEK